MLSLVVFVVSIFFFLLCRMFLRFSISFCSCLDYVGCLSYAALSMVELDRAREEGVRLDRVEEVRVRIST